MRKIVELVKKHKGLFLYIAFGILTTLVNYLVYFPLFYIAGFTALLSNAIAWFTAVLFSYFTNKPFVFESNDWTFWKVLRELTGFLGCRLLTGALESAVLFVFVDVLSFSGFVFKIIVSIAVVILNYIFSRIFIFKENEQHPID